MLIKTSKPPTEIYVRHYAARTIKPLLVKVNSHKDTIPAWIQRNIGNMYIPANASGNRSGHEAHTEMKTVMCVVRSS